MRVISRKTIKEFLQGSLNYADAKGPLEAWYAEAKKASWKGPQQIKALYRNASILKNNRVVFNIAGNKYRLIVHINYRVGIIFIRFVGTHKQYDKINAETI